MIRVLNMIYENYSETGKKVLIAWDSCILLFFFTRGSVFLLAQYSLKGIWSHTQL